MESQKEWNELDHPYHHNCLPSGFEYRTWKKLQLVKDWGKHHWKHAYRLTNLTEEWGLDAASSTYVEANENMALLAQRTQGEQYDGDTQLLTNHLGSGLLRGLIEAGAPGEVLAWQFDAGEGCKAMGTTMVAIKHGNKLVVQVGDKLYCGTQVWDVAVERRKTTRRKKKHNYDRIATQCGYVYIWGEV